MNFFCDTIYVSNHDVRKIFQYIYNNNMRKKRSVFYVSV